MRKIILNCLAAVLLRTEPKIQNTAASKALQSPFLICFLHWKYEKGFTDIIMIIRNTSAGQTWAKSIILTLAELSRFSYKLKINQEYVMTLHFLLRVIRIALVSNIVYKWQVDGQYFWRDYCQLSEMWEMCAFQVFIQVFIQAENKSRMCNDFAFFTQNYKNCTGW